MTLRVTKEDLSCFSFVYLRVLRGFRLFALFQNFISNAEQYANCEDPVLCLHCSSSCFRRKSSRRQQRRQQNHPGSTSSVTDSVESSHTHRRDWRSSPGHPSNAT